MVRPVGRRQSTVLRDAAVRRPLIALFFVAQLIVIVVLLVDSVERARATKTLRESEERPRRAILDAPIPIMMYAEDGEVILINRQWTELTGHTHAEITAAFE